MIDQTSLRASLVAWMRWYTANKEEIKRAPDRCRLFLEATAKASGMQAVEMLASEIERGPELHHVQNTILLKIEAAFNHWANSQEPGDDREGYRLAAETLVNIGDALGPPLVDSVGDSNEDDLDDKVRRLTAALTTIERSDAPGATIVAKRDDGHACSWCRGMLTPCPVETARKALEEK